MSVIAWFVVWFAVRFAYLIGGLLVLGFVGAVLNTIIDRRIERHLRRANHVPYLPVEAALRRHPSNVRRIDSKVDGPRRLG